LNVFQVILISKKVNPGGRKRGKEREQKDSVIFLLLLFCEHRRKKFIARRAWEVIKKGCKDIVYDIYTKMPKGF